MGHSLKRYCNILAISGDILTVGVPEPAIGEGASDIAFGDLAVVESVLDEVDRKSVV